MEILTYSPKVEAYVAATNNGSTVYYDLTQDITSCSVNRKVDAASTFSIKLQNKNGKYNDLFAPMDRVVIYATGADGKRYQQMTGYIKSVPKFRLFNQDFNIEGRCSIYRLQELFWDPSLNASQRALGMSDTDSNWDKVLKTLLMDVAGMDSSQIYVGDVPAEVINWAYQLYAAQKEDIADTKTLVEDFYSVIKTSSPTFASSSSGASTSDVHGNSNAEKIWNFCIENGCTKQVAAALVGNAMQESGCNPEAAGVAYGAFQFEGASGLAALQAWASEHGGSWNTLEVQLPYLFSVLPRAFEVYTGLSPHYYSSGEWCWWPNKMSFDEYKKLSDIAKATEIFERVYERASIPRLEKRISYAQSAYEEFAG